MKARVYFHKALRNAFIRRDWHGITTIDGGKCDGHEHEVFVDDSRLDVIINFYSPVAGKKFLLDSTFNLPKWEFTFGEKVTHTFSVGLDEANNSSVIKDFIKGWWTSERRDRFLSKYGKETVSRIDGLLR